MLLEVCIDSVDSAIAAQRGGGQRVELCSGLTEGGLTPSLGQIEAVVEAVEIDVMVILRPRGGDFMYSPHEQDVLLKDLSYISKSGIKGIVFGALLADGSIDTELTQRIRDKAGELDFTFHRAFDMCLDPIRGIEDLLKIGIPRLLTSGLAESAMEGKETIKTLVNRVGGEMKIMAGGGLTPQNVGSLVEFTGVKEIHATCRKSIRSGMKFSREGVYMGIKGNDEYQLKIADSHIVERMLMQVMEK